MKRAVVATVLVVLLAVGGASCQKRSATQKQAGKAAGDEQTAISNTFAKLSGSQQVPSFDWSQERQTVIDTETIRATGAVSTTMGYLEGIGLIWWCPSAGAPVPSTYQLSASTQYADIPGDRSREIRQIDQGEPTGVYIGASSGTWTLCLDDNGKKFAHYWEGYVASDIGIVNGLDPQKRLRIDEATFKFTERKR